MTEISQKTILVADDDSDARTIVASAVSVMGYLPIEASDGRQALSMFQEINPDLVILDMMMPQLNGGEVCQIIKRSATGTHVPVIMLTALDNVKDKVSALEEGADDYITKPFHYQELQARIRALLRVRELNIELHRTNEELRLVQDKLIRQERQLLVMQLAGTAAHQLGQPLSAIMLNCYVLEHVPTDDEKFRKALEAIKADSKRMSEMIEKLKRVDPNRQEDYHGATTILGVQGNKE